MQAEGNSHPATPCILDLRTIPAIAVLFLADWIWMLSAEQHIPLIIIPILVAIHVKSMKAPGANEPNIHQAKTATVGIALFVPIHIALVGLSNLSWW